MSLLLFSAAMAAASTLAFGTIEAGAAAGVLSGVALWFGRKVVSGL